MTPVPRITCEICPGPFFHPRIKLRARIAHGRPGNEAIKRGVKVDGAGWSADNS